MLYLKNKINMKFKTVKEPFIECGLGEDFYVLVYSDFTAVYHGKSSKVCFPIPVHYPSFVYTLTGKINVKVEELFNFESVKDKEKFKEYVNGCNFNEVSVINEFKPIKKKKSV